MKPTQPLMFTHGEDMPLFSGTPQVVTVAQAPRVSQAQQAPLPFGCRVCRDTGSVLVGKTLRRCTCAAGRKA